MNKLFKFERMKANELKRAGFTITELLVVLAVISALVALIVPVIAASMRNSKIQRAKADTANIASAIRLLQHDTNRWPNGCPAGKLMCNPEADFSTDQQAGIGSTPPVAGYGGADEVASRCENGWADANKYYNTFPAVDHCQWTAADINKWSGPYMSDDFVDPWGAKYLFDPDYFGLTGDEAGIGGCVHTANRCNNNCATYHDGIAIFSMGPDRSPNTCDDIAYFLYTAN